MDEILPFHAQPSSGVPIYRQIVTQVTALTAGGQLAPGEFLPSVRSVAESLSVNPMTVSKAYSQLESEGVVERVRGKGMRVRPSAIDSMPDRKAALRGTADQLASHARQLGLTDAQAISVVKVALKANKSTSPSSREDAT